MSITRDQIQYVNEKAKGLKAMVIGDAMLDRYIFGVVDRISPEAPVPVLSHQRSETKAGGAANVALNMAAWGCQTSIVGLTGSDKSADELSNILTGANIKHYFIQTPLRPTTTKTRVVAASHHLLRIDEEDPSAMNEVLEKEALDLLSDLIPSVKPDLIILEDYNKGFLTPAIIELVIKEGRKAGAFIAVDPKEINFFNYTEIDLFKPNQREASQAARLSLVPGNMDELCGIWRNQLKIKNLAITIGSHGIYLQNATERAWVLPEKAIDVVDVCGAGDAVIGALSLGLLLGLPLNTCGALANLAGAYVCSHSGVVVVDVKELAAWK